MASNSETEAHAVLAYNLYRTLYYEDIYIPTAYGAIPDRRLPFLSQPRGHVEFCRRSASPRRVQHHTYVLFLLHWVKVRWIPK